MTLGTEHLLSASLLNPILWNERKGPLTPCPEVLWSLYLGPPRETLHFGLTLENFLLGVFAPSETIP